jgi:hypothetical protein
VATAEVILGNFGPCSSPNKRNLTGHFEDGLEVFGAQRHHREPRLADQGDVLELRLRFDFGERDRPRQRFNRGKIDCAPIASFAVASR